jgi:hypothetical protein
MECISDDSLLSEMRLGMESGMRLGMESVVSSRVPSAFDGEWNEGSLFWRAECIGRTADPWKKHRPMESDWELVKSFYLINCEWLTSGQRLGMGDVVLLNRLCRGIGHVSFGLLAIYLECIWAGALE